MGSVPRPLPAYMLKVLEKHPHASLDCPSGQWDKLPNLIHCIGIKRQTIGQVGTLDKLDMTALLVLHHQVQQ